MLKDVPIYDTKIQNYSAKLADKAVVPIFFISAITFAMTKNIFRLISMMIFDFSTGIRIAAPTAVLSSMFNLGQKGILIKSGGSLEKLAQYLLTLTLCIPSTLIKFCKKYCVKFSSL